MMYYCWDCQYKTHGVGVEEQFPFEFWGETGWHKETFIVCEHCGSFNIEELENDM